MSKVPVTIVIPTIKMRKHLLKRAVDSVYSQSFPSRLYDVVVAMDRTREGSAATRNRALQQVRTSWVAFLDDDDYFLPWHLSVLFEAANNSSADVIYPGCRVIDGMGRTIPRQEEWGRYGKQFDPELLRQRSYIPVTSLCRTDYAKQAMFGPPKEAPGSEYDDWGFYLRMLDQGANFLHVPVTTWVWSHHGRNTSGRADRW